MDSTFLDTSYTDPSVKAASVVTNLWIAAFAITSALFALLGGIVAVQWPRPNVLCYKTSYSDMPSNSMRSCCSLYSLNLGFTVFWLLVFAIMVIARDLVRIIICLCFWVVHVAVVILFRVKFKRYGRPERPFNSSSFESSTLPGASSSAASPGGALGPGQAVGIPVYNIPMQTVVIGTRAGDGTSSPAAAGSQPGRAYFYDADCIPHAVGTQAAGATAAAGGAGGLAGPYPQHAAAYPPQPAAAAAPATGANTNTNSSSGGGLAVGQPVTGLPAAVWPPVPAAAPAGSAAVGGARASLEAGHAGAAAGAATAAGAGAVGPAQQPQQPR